MKTIFMSVAAAGVAGLLSTPALAAGSVAWTGASATEDSVYVYLGGLVDLDGDLGTSGIAVRAGIWGGQYDYNNGNVVGGNVDGDQYGGELLIGYRDVTANEVFAIYAGVSGEDHDLSPNDPSNPVNGDEIGVKVLLDMNLNTQGALGLDLMGSYASAFESYYINLSLPYRFTGFQIGPDFAALGSESYDQQRVGAKLGFDLGGVNLSLSGGLAIGGRDGDNSPYGGIGLSTTF